MRRKVLLQQGQRTSTFCGDGERHGKKEDEGGNAEPEGGKVTDGRNTFGRKEQRGRSVFNERQGRLTLAASVCGTRRISVCSFSAAWGESASGPSLLHTSAVRRQDCLLELFELSSTSHNVIPSLPSSNMYGSEVCRGTVASVSERRGSPRAPHRSILFGTIDAALSVYRR